MTDTMGKRDTTPKTDAMGKPLRVSLRRYDAGNAVVLEATGEMGPDECGRLRDTLWPELGLLAGRPLVMDFQGLGHTDHDLWAMLRAAGRTSTGPLLVILAPGSQPEQTFTSSGAQGTPARISGLEALALPKKRAAGTGSGAAESTRRHVLQALALGIPAGLLLLWLALALVYRALQVP